MPVVVSACGSGSACIGRRNIAAAAAPVRHLSKPRLVNWFDMTAVPSFRRQSVCASSLPGSVLPMDAKVSFHGVPVDHSAEGEHVPRLGAKHYMAEVHRAFNSSRLVRSLEMPGQGIAVLHDLDRVRACLAVVAMG